MDRQGRSEEVAEVSDSDPQSADMQGGQDPGARRTTYVLVDRLVNFALWFSSRVWEPWYLFVAVLGRGGWKGG